MATGPQNIEGVPENLRNQLALAVRNIQWSYAIFWSISTRQSGVLEWGDGYYNGDIKTRKTVQAVEFNADQMGLQRSEQLRELYESLSIGGESSPQPRRHCAALSPEDLTDAEWYYLVCMSFVFDVGQGLPGRTLATGQPVWLCNAHCADSKVFSRSLLAKSASIQTVACFPYLGGVIELGVTEMVMEDPSLIQRIETSFLDIPCPIQSKISSSRIMREEKDRVSAELDHNFLDPNLNPVVVEVGSASNSSDGLEQNQLAEESVMVEGINCGGASQVQSWHFMEDEFSNCVHNSINSSDCISQTFMNPEKVINFPKGEKVNDHCLAEVQECNNTKLTSLDLRDDLHYQGVLSSLLKSSHQLILGPCFQNSNKESSFVSWKRRGLMGIQKLKTGTQQKLLKKVLFEVAQMHGGCLMSSRENHGENDEIWRPEADEIGLNHVLSERRRREKINERFSALRSLVPSINKVNKVSVLDDTIEYLKELKRRVDELESSKELIETEARTSRRSQDTAERTSDNYCNNKAGNGKKPLLNKRKARDIDQIEPEANWVLLKDDSTENVTVSTKEKDVLIEIRCPWRESLLLEIIDAVSNLHLDSQSVHSSHLHGILSLTIKSKFRGSTVATAETIKQALQSVVPKC